jgi:hypothetical protein
MVVLVPASRGSEAEELLDLLREHCREHPDADEQDHEDDPEAQAGATCAPHVSLARTTAGSMEPVRACDRRRVDGREFGRGCSGGRRIGRDVSLELVGHARKCTTVTRVCVIDHTVAPMSADRFRTRPGLDRDLLSLGDQLGFVSGLVLAVSAFTAWYTGTGEGVTVSVVGWHTGTLGKLVFLLGAVIVVLVVLRELGVALPATIPESLVFIAIGVLATIFVLVRLISIPDDFFFAGRGIGIWISLVAAIGVIAAGLLQASDEMAA